jgi:hypothetical protein
VVLTSLGSFTPKIAVIAIIGVVVILVLVLTMLPKGECAKVQIPGTSVEVGCSGNQAAPTPSPATVQTPPPEPTPVPASFNIVGVWNFQGQLQGRQANGAIAPYSTSGTIEFLPDGTVHMIYSQFGGVGTNWRTVGTYSLQNGVLTLTPQNGQTTNDLIQVIDPDHFRVYNPTGLWFYTATRAAV